MSNELGFGDAFLRGAVRKDTGQLVSLVLEDQHHHAHEFMHPGGRETGTTDGWANTEILMWPIVSTAADDTLWFPAEDLPHGYSQKRIDEYMAEHGRDERLFEGLVPLRQTGHGIARWLGPSLVEAIDNGVRVVYEYDPENPVKGKGGLTLDWPYKTTMEKRFMSAMTGRGIPVLKTRITITNHGPGVQPYALGWHPSFALRGERPWFGFTNASKDGGVLAEDQTWTGEGSMLYRSAGRLVGVTHEMLYGAIWKRGPQACLEPTTVPMMEDVNLVRDRFSRLVEGESDRYHVTIIPQLR